MRLKPILSFPFVSTGAFVFISVFAATSLWAQAPAADPAAGKVVATVAGKDITAADVQKMLSLLNAQEVQRFYQDPQFILSGYFLFLHLAEEGEKEKLLEKSPYKEQFEVLKQQILRNAKVNEENNTFPIPPEMVDSYYRAHSAQYEQAKIKVIYIPYAGTVVPTGTGAAALESAAKQAIAAGQSKRPEAEARTLAADIVKQLRGGADFVKLVQQYSEDPTSKAAGGDFGFIKAGSEYPAELKTAVFAMKPGEISDPIRQPTAFWIIRLEEKGPQPVGEVGEGIVTTLRNDHLNQWMKEQTATYQVVLKDSDFFKAPAPTPPAGFPGVLAPKN
jgi:parvulin-like peptidyl-prolyl isomerase